MAITLTEQQFNQLKPYAYENYINELVTHCDQHYPYFKAMLGEEKLTQIIYQGVEKAKLTGFTQRGAVQLYIDLLIILGWSFETDPQYYWLQETLQTVGYQPQINTATTLYQQVNTYLDTVSGKNGEYLFVANEKIAQLSLETINVRQNHFMQDMLDLLQVCHVQKYQLTDQDQLVLLIQNGIKKSKIDYQLQQPESIALMVVLMFLIGHKFDHDPFYQGCNWKQNGLT